MKAVDIADGPEGRDAAGEPEGAHDQFREGLQSLGFESIPARIRSCRCWSATPIGRARSSAGCFDRGILAVGLTYPVVPRGDETIRFQVNAAHTRQTSMPCWRRWTPLGVADRADATGLRVAPAASTLPPLSGFGCSRGPCADSPPPATPRPPMPPPPIRRRRRDRPSPRRRPPRPPPPPGRGPRASPASASRDPTADQRAGLRADRVRMGSFARERHLQLVGEQALGLPDLHLDPRRLVRRVSCGHRPSKRRAPPGDSAGPVRRPARAPPVARRRAVARVRAPAIAAPET